MMTIGQTGQPSTPGNDPAAMLQAFVGFAYGGVLIYGLQGVFGAIANIDWGALPADIWRQRVGLEQLALGLTLLLAVVKYYLVAERLQRTAGYNHTHFVLDFLIVIGLFLGTQLFSPDRPVIAGQGAGATLMPRLPVPLVRPAAIYATLFFVYVGIALRLTVLDVLGFGRSKRAGAANTEERAFLDVALFWYGAAIIGLIAGIYFDPPRFNVTRGIAGISLFLVSSVVLALVAGMRSGWGRRVRVLAIPFWPLAVVALTFGLAYWIVPETLAGIVLSVRPKVSMPGVLFILHFLFLAWLFAHEMKRGRGRETLNPAPPTPRRA